MRSLKQKTGRLIGIGSIVIAGCLAIAVPVQAAEELVLRYGIFRGSVPIADLNEFAETGETSRSLRRYLRLAKEDPEKFRQFLTAEAPVESRNLDRLLDSPAGDVLLDEFSKYLYTPDQDDREALRTALKTAVEDDQKISFLEVLQDYPAEAAHINVRRAISTYQQVIAIQSRVDGVLGGQLDNVLQQIDLF